MSYEYQLTAKKVDFDGIAKELAQQGYCLSSSAERLEVFEDDIPIMSICPHNGGVYLAWHGGAPGTRDSLLGAVLLMIAAYNKEVVFSEL
ncbi:MAG: hypothetical protein AAGC71_03755 [Pseudomonadota bacterium]